MLRLYGSSLCGFHKWLRCRAPLLFASMVDAGHVYNNYNVVYQQFSFLCIHLLRECVIFCCWLGWCTPVPGGRTPNSVQELRDGRWRKLGELVEE